MKFTYVVIPHLWRSIILTYLPHNRFFCRFFLSFCSHTFLPLSHAPPHNSELFSPINVRWLSSQSTRFTVRLSGNLASPLRVDISVEKRESTMWTVFMAGFRLYFHYKREIRRYKQIYLYQKAPETKFNV